MMHREREMTINCHLIHIVRWLFFGIWMRQLNTIRQVHRVLNKVIIIACFEAIMASHITSILAIVFGFRMQKWNLNYYSHSTSKKENIIKNCNFSIILFARHPKIHNLFLFPLSTLNQTKPNKSTKQFHQQDSIALRTNFLHAINFTRKLNVCVCVCLAWKIFFCFFLFWYVLCIYFSIERKKKKITLFHSCFTLDRMNDSIKKSEEDEMVFVVVHLR